MGNNVSFKPCNYNLNNNPAVGPDISMSNTIRSTLAQSVPD